MSRRQDDEVVKVSRREAVTRLMAAGMGMASILYGSKAIGQVGAPPVLTPPPNARFPTPSSWDTELIQLRPNIYAYVQAGGVGRGSGAGVSNAGIIVGEDHLLLIDTLGEPILVDSLKAAIRKKIGTKPVGRIIDTHQHGDHVGGNQYFMPVEIVGHPFCRDTVARMAADLPPGAKFDKHPGWATGREDKKLIPPSVTIADKQTYRYNKIAVEVSHPGVAHTWGDLMVYLPEHKILFAADIAVFRMTPWAHNGNVAQWLEVIDKIMGMDVETIVPGHGPIGGKKDLAEVREYFVLLQREARKRFDAGISPGKAAADIDFGKFENWIGAERNLLNTFRIYGEFDGSQTPALDVPGMNRAAAEYNAIIKQRLA